MELYRLINLIFLCIINGSFTIVGALLNSIVIICLWKSAQLRKGTSNFMILLLSFFDLLVIITGHPAVILSAVSWSSGNNTLTHWSTKPTNRGYRLVEVAILVSNCTKHLSLPALLAVTIDRYIAITRPFFHQIYVTKRRLLALSFVMQLLMVAVGMFRFFKDFKAIYYGGLLFLAGTEMIAVATMNYKMWRIAASVKHQRRTSKTQLKHLKKNFTCLLAVACFFISLTPLLVYAILRAASSGVLSEDTLLLLRLWGNTSLNTSSTWNCLIFFWRNEILCNSGKKLLLSCFKR